VLFSQTYRVSEDIELVKISENVFIHVSYFHLPKYGRVGANGAVFIQDGKAFLFDTPWTSEQTETLLTWLKDSLSIEVVGFVPNHWHEDCMGGLGYIKEQNIQSYANQITLDSARAKGLPIPNVGFTDSLVLILGNKKIECHYAGAAHTTDNIVVWIPSEKILFPGCMVKCAGSKNLGNTVDGDLQAYPKTLKALLTEFSDAQTVIPGHGRYGGLEIISNTIAISEKLTH